VHENLSPKYVLILASVAGVVLVVGAALRPKKAPPPQPSASERANLQRTVRREELREMASFFAERAGALARFVVYLPDRNATGVLWGNPGQVVTAAQSDAELPTAPIESVQIGTTEAPPATQLAEGSAGRWVLIAARSADPKLVWTVAMNGGARQSDCGGVAFREIALNAPLAKSLAGGGVFDLDGAFLGLVIRCGGSYHVAAAASINELLKASDAVENKLLWRFGVGVAPPNENTAKLFNDESGVLITELRYGGAAARMGLDAGDLIVSAGDQPVSSDAQLFEALDRGELTSFVVIRAGRKITIKPPGSSDRTLGIDFLPQPRTSAVLSVDPGTPAFQAGLRTGDRILQIGPRPEPSAFEIRRMLAASAGKPLMIVYERESRRAAVVRVP